jgi:hypothetical protein
MKPGEQSWRMKSRVRRFYCVLAGFVFATSLSPAAAADTNPPPRLTVELRDGSRVVGTSVEKYFKFHSALLGDLKLDVKDIRSVECVSSNAAKLSTANGDSLAVSFVDPAFALKTSFGKVELPVDSLRKFSVASGLASGTYRLPGLVALWSAEGDARDSVGGNHGVLEGKIGFAPGKLGQAFSFADENADVKIPASASLNVGAGGGFTLAAWINPSDVSGHHPLFEWNTADGTTYWGVHFYIDADSFNAGPGALYGNILDSAGNWHQIHSASGAVVAGAFQHVALTYEKNSGLAKIYCNGVLIAQQFLGRFNPQTSFDLYLGKRPLTQGETYTFAGLLDEAAIYNRALSAPEIQTICRQDNNGEPLPPPAGAPVLMPANGMFRFSSERVFILGPEKFQCASFRIARNCFIAGDSTLFFL